MKNKNVQNPYDPIFFLSIAKFPSKKGWEEYAWLQIVKQMIGMKTPETLRKLFQLFFSPSERKDATYRAAGLAMLYQGATNRMIRKELKLSPHTIKAIRQSKTEHSYQSAYVLAKLAKPKPTPPTRGTIWDERRDATRVYRNTKFGKLRM